MKKILFIQQYLGKNKEVGPIFPIGLSYIITAVRNKTDFQIKALDLNICQQPYKELISTLSIYEPDICGLSIRNIDNVDYDSYTFFLDEVNFLTGILKQFCNCIIAGGAGFSIFGNEIMKKNHDIDFGVRLEGEETFVELLNKLENNKSIENVKGIYYRKDSEIVFTGERCPLEFEKSKAPIRDYFAVPIYDKPLCLGVQTKRGCPLKCSYCTYPFLNKDIIRLRLPVDVVDEIEDLVEKYAVKEIIFCDDVFNAPEQHAENIIKEMINRNLKIKWSAWFDAGNTTEHLLDLAIKSGCYRVCFSVDGVTNTTLTALQKNFDAKKVWEIEKICSKRKYKNIEFRYSLFALPPKQTFFGILKTLKFIFKTHVIHLNSKCLTSWIRILPNTEIQKLLKKSEEDLLPTIITEKTKNELFYLGENISPKIVELYMDIINYMNILRKFHKQIRGKLSWKQ